MNDHFTNAIIHLRTQKEPPESGTSAVEAESARFANTGAVIVAAGLSSRMGDYKPLMEIGDKTVAQRVIGAFADAGVTPIVVVTGHRADELEAHLMQRVNTGRKGTVPVSNKTNESSDSCPKSGDQPFGQSGRRNRPLLSTHGKNPSAPCGDTFPKKPPLLSTPDDSLSLLFVRNENYETTSMYESAMIGLSFIMEKCARTFFCPIDIPLFTADTVRKLMKSDASVVKPVCGGKEGHPILIDTRLIPALSGSEPAREAAEPDEPERNGARSEEGGLKVALAKFENVTVRIEVNDDGILYDADTPEDMRKLIDML